MSVEESLTITNGAMGAGAVVTVRKLALNKIKLGRNSRLSVSKEELDGLMQSIKETGLLQPIGVIQKRAGTYEICYGNRRFMACSKLGFSHIPAMVHIEKKASDTDMKNLAENIQRRNISLAEAGRYIELLKAEGLGAGEVAVRLGVPVNYVHACISAYKSVPKEYHDSLEVRVKKDGTTKRTPGKISMRAAQAIINSQKSYRLSNKQTKPLFEAAKNDPEFDSTNVKKYAAHIAAGHKDFLKKVKPLRNIHVRFLLTAEDALELERKYVDNGPFNSLNGLVVAILRGEKVIKFPDIKSF